MTFCVLRILRVYLRNSAAVQPLHTMHLVVVRIYESDVYPLAARQQWLFWCKTHVTYVCTSSSHSCLLRVFSKQVADKGTRTALPWVVAANTSQRDTVCVHGAVRNIFQICGLNWTVCTSRTERSSRETELLRITFWDTDADGKK